MERRGGTSARGGVYRTKDLEKKERDKREISLANTPGLRRGTITATFTWVFVEGEKERGERKEYFS